jgi:hypothetical protein
LTATWENSQAYPTHIPLPNSKVKEFKVTINSVCEESVFIFPKPYFGEIFHYQLEASRVVREFDECENSFNNIMTRDNGRSLSTKKFCGDIIHSLQITQFK